MKYGTATSTAAHSHPNTWLKVFFSKVHCVERVIRRSGSGSNLLAWTCTNIDCSDCKGGECGKYTLTVSTEGTASDLPTVGGCKNGDTVEFARKDLGNFQVNELLVFEKQGNSTIIIYHTFKFCIQYWLLLIEPL